MSVHATRSCSLESGGVGAIIAGWTEPLHAVRGSDALIARLGRVELSLVKLSEVVTLEVKLSCIPHNVLIYSPLLGGVLLQQ